MRLVRFLLDKSVMNLVVARMRILKRISVVVEAVGSKPATLLDRPCRPSNCLWEPVHGVAPLYSPAHCIEYHGVAPLGVGIHNASYQRREVGRSAGASRT